jgi:hypothetical protein
MPDKIYLRFAPVKKESTSSEKRYMFKPLSLNLKKFLIGLYLVSIIGGPADLLSFLLYNLLRSYLIVSYKINQLIY